MESYERLCTNKLDNLDEMEDFLEISTKTDRINRKPK